MHHTETFEIIGAGVRKRRSKDDDYIWTLRNLDLTIYSGERLALVGNSGSGKTTLLRLLADLEKPDEGKILFEGQPISSYEPRSYRRKVGFVRQTPALFDKAVEDNFRFAFEASGGDYSREKAGDLLRKVGLDEKLLGAKSDTLSVGQAQRVSIARALAADPAVLLMDEPTSALDPHSAKSIVQLIENLSRELEITAVLVLHNLELAKRGTDRVALLQQGKIDSIGKTEEFFANPPTELARRFVEGEQIED
ncbi:MAG: ABC transporter ATP-binding protein [bacterium]